MTEEQMDLINLREYYLIKSTATNKPYIDEKRCCYMFDASLEADTFISSHKNTTKADRAFYREETFCTEFYKVGIRGICVRLAKENQWINISIEKVNVRKQFYNAETNGTILLLKETSKKKYLRELQKSQFLVPVEIIHRRPGQCPSLHYCYAIARGNRQYYILFTTIQEFEQWSSSQKQEWEPLQMDLREFDRIRLKHDILINPLSDELVLTNQQIAVITGDMYERHSRNQIHRPKTGRKQAG